MGLAPTQEKNGADGRIRTDDLLITNQLLCQLSYISSREKMRRTGRYVVHYTTTENLHS